MPKRTPRVTVNRGIRFTDEELVRADALLAQFPEFRSQADVLHQAALIGLLVLATQATRPGLLAYAGYEADDLAALLKYRLMSTLDFLVAQNAVPAALMRPTNSHDEPQVCRIANNPDTMLIGADAAEGLDDLGSVFME
jgi:hypothetical protein